MTGTSTEGNTLMLKKLIAMAGFVLASALALPSYAVDVNTADKATLDGVKGIGPKTAEAIIAERNKGGAFKDWDDLIKRVKGVGEKNASTMSTGGLTVNNQAKPNAPASKAAERKKDAPKSDAGTGGKPASTAASTAASTDDSKSKSESKRKKAAEEKNKKADETPESKK